MPDLAAAEVYAYIACSICSRRVDAEIGATSCCGYCTWQETKAVIRSTLKGAVSDGTDSVRITAFGTQVEEILELTAEEIYSFKLRQGDEAFDRKLTHIKKKEMLMHISPTYDLSLSNTLKWVVRAVEPVQIESSQKRIGPLSAVTTQSRSETLAMENQDLSDAVTERRTKRRHGKSPERVPESPPERVHNNRLRSKSPERVLASPLDDVGADSDDGYDSIEDAQEKKKPEETSPVPSENVVEHSDEKFSDEVAASPGLA